MKTFLSIIAVLVFGGMSFSQTVSNTYTSGNIGTYYDSSSPYTVDNTCNGSSTVLAVNLPVGGPWEVTSIDIVYNMTATGGAWMSEQRSLIYCQNTTTSENGGTWYSGSGGSAGTYNYNRTTVNIANGIYAGGTALNFEMWADRTWGGSGCGTSYNYVVDGTWTITVNYQAPPTCPDISAISSSNVTGSTADISWTAGGSESTWDIEYGVKPHTFDGSEDVNNTTNNSPHQLTGLLPLTTYEYKVRADCGGGDESNWSATYEFTTLCATYSTPYTEDFEAHSTTTNATWGNCWTADPTGTTSSYRWDLDGSGSTPSSSTGPNGANSGSKYAYTEASSGSTGSIAKLISPSIDLSGLSVPMLSFYYHMYGSTMGTLYVDVYDGSSWTDGVCTISGQQQASGSDAWLEQEVMLDAYSGVIQLRFRAERSTDYYGDISIDDVSIIEAPTCPNPSNITASNITGSTANISWTQGGSPSQWDIEYGVKPHTFDGSEDVNNTTNNPHQLTGLSNLTTYQYMVRSDCGAGDKGDWLGPFEFSTTCATITAAILPFTEDFEGLANTQLDDGFFHCSTNHMWYLDTDNSNGKVRYGTDAVITNGGTGAMTLDMQGYAWTTSYAIMTIDLSSYSAASDLYLSFDYTDHSDADEAEDKVWVRGSDSDAWIQIYDFNHAAVTNGTYNSVIDLDIVTTLGAQTPSSTFQLRFGWRGTDDATSSTCCEGVSFDNVCIYTCPKPSSLTASSIAANQADLAWVENGGATIWDIELGINGFSPTGTPTQSGVTSNPYTYTGLTAETDYQFYVRSDCGSDNSVWVGPFDFTTTVSCPNPTLGTATNITTTSADLGWTVGALETQWDIELGLDGFIATGVPIQAGVSSNPYTYNGLVPGTAYDFWVRANCGVGDESIWVGPFSFTTNILVGQVYVTASLGTASAVYNTLKEAFDKINDGTHQGTIDIEIGANDGETITETAAASLNKSGSGSASYTSVTVTPGAANIKLVSNISGGCCVPTGTVKLNVAENVIFDGRQGAVGSTIDLTIENTSTGSWAGAFTFVAATNNILRYCTLKSGSTGNGTITFSDNNVGGGAGSSNNLVEECHVTKSGSNLPMHAIAGDGANGRENVNNTIKNCTIYDFEKFGVFLGSSGGDAYNRRWTIEGNTIYQTTAFTGMLAPQIGICVGYPYANGDSGERENGTFTIKDNTIGGNGSGGYWTWSGGAYPVAGIHIYCTYDTDSTHSTIDGNVITMFDIESSSGNLGSSSKSVFTGIISNNCRTYIGNTKANTIGSLTDPDNIKFRSTAGTGNIYGINMSTNGDHANRIINNVISGISITEGTGGMSFHGIHNNCATTNTSDSISQNNISYITLTKCNYFIGISGNGYFCKNRIRDIDFTGNDTWAELVGIYWSGGDVLNRGVENNEIILGRNKAGASIAGNDKIIGVELGREVQMYYNSILIEGTSTGSDNAIGIYVDWSTDPIIQDNLVYLERSGGTGNHYAIYNDLGGSWTSSNNAYVLDVGGANTYLGYWDQTSSNIVDLATWQAITGETNSLSDTPVNQPVNTLFPLLATQDNLDVPDPCFLDAGIPSIALKDIRNSLRGAAISTIGAYEKSLLLPVELVSFSGQCIDGNAKLYWETASEVNNDFFLIQTSEDGRDWDDVATVKGAGNTNSLTMYEYTDYMSADILYYRLKQVDFDGTYVYSNIINITCADEDLEIMIYPNPAKNEFNILLGKLKNRNAKFKLYNSIGQKVKEDKIINRRTKVDVSTVPRGIYMMVLELDSQTTVRKKILVE